MGKLNWKKLLLFTAVSSALPGLQNWATSVTTDQAIPFTLGNIVVPAIPAIITTLAALFSNPRSRS